MTEKNAFKNLSEKMAESDGTPVPLGAILSEYGKRLGNGTQDLLGIETGLGMLDKKTSGLDGLIVLGGMAGQGKTSLALQLAFKACESKVPVLFYSLEMPRWAIMTKMLSRLSHVDYGEILLKGGQYLGGEEWKQDSLEFEKFGRMLASLSVAEQSRLKNGHKILRGISDRFYVRTREHGDMDIHFENVEKEIHHLKLRHITTNVFVVVDYLQVFPLGDYKDSMDKEGRLVNGFRRLCERTGATIILISQKNKSGFENRVGLQSIKGNLDIAYLADVVMFLEEPKEEQHETIARTPVATTGESVPIDLVIAKNRYNVPGKVSLQFNGRFSEFTEREKSPESR